MNVVDLFAGMGGWDLAARQLDVDPLGIEHNPDACATREAAGLATLQGFPPHWPVQGTKTAQWLQVGNAIPPPLAHAILTQLIPAQETAA